MLREQKLLLAGRAWQHVRKAAQQDISDAERILYLDAALGAQCMWVFEAEHTFPDVAAIKEGISGLVGAMLDGNEVETRHIVAPAPPNVNRN